MGFLNETMKRASVQSLREYFLYGVDGEKHSTISYEVRIKKAEKMWRDVVKEYDAEGEDSKLYRAISDILAEHEHVYMELGIQTGFQLARDIDRNGEDEKLYDQYKEMYSSLFQDVTKVIEELKRAQKEAEEMYISS